MIAQYIKHIEKSFSNAEENKSKISQDIINLVGMSGTKTRHLYNNLLELENATYLEIGSWLGSTVCSAMYKNNAIVVCIDNFLRTDGNPRKRFLRNFNKFKENNNAIFIEKDCFDIDSTTYATFPKFNVYLYDGGHSEQDHYNALKYYYDCLDDLFIYIVDDWNWADVRNGTIRAIKDLNLTILHEKEIRLTQDESHTPIDLAKTTWWNGVYVVLLQKI